MRQTKHGVKASLLALLFAIMALSGCVGNSDDGPASTYKPMELAEPAGPASIVAKMNMQGQLKVGEILTFEDTSIIKNDKFASRIWEFSDGGNDVGRTVIHSFDEPGKYTIKLTVHTESGLTDFIRKHVQVIEILEETEDFVGNFTFETEDLKAIYTPITSGGVGQLLYSWNFGDGTTSQLYSPVHYYEAAGTFRVELTIQDQANQVVRSIAYVSVEYPDPGAGESGHGPGAANERGYDEAGAHGDPEVPDLMVEIDYTSDLLIFDFIPVVGNAFGASISYSWEFGDDTYSNQEQPLHLYAEYIPYLVKLSIQSSDGRTASDMQWVEPTIVVEFEPHVVVGIPDTGINPYHLGYYRPNRMFHPCEYLQGYPCDIEELPLTVGGSNWAAAFQADQDLWQDVKPGVWYWIPKTVFVATMCEAPFDPGNGNICIFDDSHPHGTGTTSSVLTEEPEALISFVEFAPTTAHWVNDGIPVDLVSVSWGAASGAPAPASGAIRPYPAFDGDSCGVNDDIRAVNIYVKSAGNDPGASTYLECWSGSPYVISVGGGQAADRTRALMAYTEPDIVSYFCRPVFSTMQATGFTDSCGTSFAGPTVAGGIAKVILGLRKSSGYLGNIQGDYYSDGNGIVDPILDISVEELRDAVYLTATYDPVAQYPNTGDVPINEDEPWRDWAWGFYDGLVAKYTLDYMLDQYDPPAKDPVAVQFMEDRKAQKQEWYG